MLNDEIIIECPKFGDIKNLWGDKARRDYADLNKLVNECMETLNTREDVEALNFRKGENTRTQYEEINLKKLEMENWKKETVVFLEK